MLTYNIDTADGLVNGAVGQLKKLEYCFVKGLNNKEVKRIWLEVSNPNDIGKEKRRQCIRYTIQNKMGLLWTPIERVKKAVYRSNNDAISVARNQFSDILAEAMTFHKSQGATFQEAAIGFKRNLTRPIQYVALSRVTSIQGLYILGEYKAPLPPREDDLILQELKRLKGNSILPKYAFLHQHNNPNTLQIMYHNVQSLNAHYEDIAADPCVINSNILLFAETWTVVGDKFAFGHFDDYHLVSHHSRRKPSGVSIYIKKQLSSMVDEVEMFPNYETGVYVMVVNFKTKGGQPFITPYLTEDVPFEVTPCYPELNDTPEEIIGTFETGHLKRIVGLQNCCRMDTVLYVWPHTFYTMKRRSHRKLDSYLQMKPLRHSPYQDEKFFTSLKELLGEEDWVRELLKNGRGEPFDE
ncbi:ATP-dependent DNA helicase [Trichonephila clavipes]|nr:ATP-dependent DNA helicase [Trichonephila clavipes]